MKENQIKTQNNIVQSDTFAAKLSIIGTYISTLGDAVAAIGDLLDIQVVEEEETALIQQNYEEQLQQMQRQIDSLSKRICRLERRGI
ncbi:hypothetical protein [Solibacillus sp. CAU 1738]|uniref:hypothetical protein n=1 Tax=Solibacillus sp. CAU 1738 TaxID=3140363 RepID=UPI003260E413